MLFYETPNRNKKIYTMKYFYSDLTRMTAKSTYKEEEKDKKKTKTVCSLIVHARIFFFFCTGVTMNI